MAQVGLRAAVGFQAARNLQENLREVALCRLESFRRVEGVEIFGLVGGKGAKNRRKDGKSEDSKRKWVTSWEMGGSGVKNCNRVNHRLLSFWKQGILLGF